jgi:predicted NBD/HSP70 family sugar kinase
MSSPSPQFSPFGGSDDLEVISDNTRSRVFSAILSAGEISRTQVARETGLSPSTVTKVVSPLLAADYLVELGTDRSAKGAGRPKRVLAVNRARHLVVGVKLHPSHVTGVLTDLGARVIARATRRLRSHGSERTIEIAAGVVRELLGSGPSTHGPVLGLGVGVGGHVNSTTGILVHSPLLGWNNIDIAGPLARLTGLPTVVNNDLDALAVAERRFGHGRAVDHFAVVSTGAGVGCGLVLGGELYSGSAGMTGEIGHMPLQPDGPQCRCGSRGCLEAIASTEAILRTIEELGGPACRSDGQAARLARTDSGSDGDAAREGFRVAGEALGRALAILCNVLNLERIILTGEGVVAYDLMQPALESAWRGHAFSTAAADCDLVVDVLDDDLWARGAACLVIDHALQSLDVTARRAVRPAESMT